MNRFFATAALIVSTLSTCTAQRVLFSSKDISIKYEGRPIRKIYRVLNFSPNIIVKYADGEISKVSVDSIWGYQDRRGRYYRFRKGSFYQICDTVGIISYRIIYRGRSIGCGDYYSHDLDSPLYGSRARARRDTI